MYQKIIELLRIHGYLSQDTEKGPCYVKSTKKRNAIRKKSNGHGKLGIFTASHVRN